MCSRLRHDILNDASQTGLSADQIQALWDKYDKDKNGSLDKTEVATMMKEMADALMASLELTDAEKEKVGGPRCWFVGFFWFCFFQNKKGLVCLLC